MLKRKKQQYKEDKEDSVSNSIYAKTYNNFGILVEKSYSPRFIESTKSTGLNITDIEESPSKYEGES